jgi:hypothetical protein
MKKQNNHQLLHIMTVTGNVSQTHFTAGEALQFCHEGKQSEVTATQNSCVSD